MTELIIFGCIAVLFWIFCGFLDWRTRREDEEWLRELERLERLRDRDRKKEMEKL